MNQPGNIDSNLYDVSSSSSSCFTGGDEIVEVLSRLPVKSLMRFKCVCKSWLSIIRNDPYFIDLHSRRSKARPVLLLMAQKLRWERYYLSADLRLPSEIGLLERGEAVCQRQSYFAISEWFDYTLEANGIFCFVDKQDHCVRIYNPSTREETPWIPSIIKQEAYRMSKDGNGQITYENLGRYEFGYDPATKEYKVIAIWRKRMYWPSFRNDCLCEVLTVGRQNNSWRKIKDVPPANLNQLTRSAHANGSIYWLIYGRGFDDNIHNVPSIVEFNIGTEKFREIPLPSFIIDAVRCVCRTDIMDIDGRLALFPIHLTNNITSLKFFILGSSIDNFGWTEETLLSMPRFDSSKSTISCVVQPVPGTDLLIVRGSHDLSFYYYKWKKKSYSSSKWEINGIDTFPVTHCKMTHKYSDTEAVFYIYTENLFSVN